MGQTNKFIEKKGRFLINNKGEQLQSKLKRSERDQSKVDEKSRLSILLDKLRRKVTLRELTLEDSERLRELFLEEKDLKDTGINVSPSEINSEFIYNWLKENISSYNSKKSSFFVYAIINGENKLIGTIGLGKINYKSNSANIGYWIAEKYAGKGYCTLAIKVFVEKVPKMFKLNKLFAEVSKTNFASCRVLEKNGFVINKELKGKLTFEKLI